jgi:hypothetical protein
MMVGGFVAIALGGASLTAALFTAIVAGAKWALGDSEAEGHRIAAAGLAIGGGIVAAAGMPLAIVGATDVPREPRDILTPTISLGPTGGSLTWRW